MDAALLIFLALGAFGGLLFGMGVGWFFGKREGAKSSPKARLERIAPPESAAAEAPAAQQAGEPAPQVAPPPPSLGLLLRRRENTLLVTLDGVTYRSYASMSADSRRRLMAYLALVRDWMQGSKATEQTKAPAAARVPPAGMAGVGAVTEKAEPLTPRDIVAQIDDIVQQLHARANLKVPVRIIAGLKGGVNILVGRERYESIDDIPDDTVRALVRRAVEIWESRQ